MADSGEIKARVVIEYDGSGVQKAKEDLASLADMAGSFESGGAGSIGDALAAMGEQAAEASKALVPLGENLGSVLAPMQEGQATVSEFTDALGEHQQTLLDTGEAYKALAEPLGTTVSMLEEAAPPMAQIAEHAQTLSEQLQPVSDGFTQVQAVMDQIALPQFADSLHQVNENFGGVGENFDQVSKSASNFADAMQSTQYIVDGGYESTRAFTEQFLGLGDAAENVSASMEGANKASGSFLDQFSNSLGTQIFGGTDTAGIESSGIFAGFGDMMMGFDQFMRPVMYAQMAAQMVTQLGTAMYNTAAVAEGPGAHSIGTFTGAVDSLGVTAQNVGGSFSEAFGQQFTATIGAVNDALGTNQGGLNLMGSALGGGLSFGLNALMGALGVPLALTGIGTPLGVGMIQAGMEGVANNFSQWMGWGTEFTGQQATPQMEYQAQVQRGVSSIPTQVVTDAANASVDAQKILIEAVNPINLQASASQAYAQQFAQTQLQRYEGQHPYNYTQELLQANDANYTQQEQYAYTHLPTYWQGMQEAASSGNWFGSNGVFSNIGGAFFGGSNSPMQGLWNFSAGNILGDLFNQGNPVSAGSFFGGIGNALSYLSPFGAAPGTPGATGGGSNWLGSMFGYNPTAMGQNIGGFFGGLGQDWNNLWNAQQNQFFPQGSTGGDLSSFFGLNQHPSIGPISAAGPVGAINTNGVGTEVTQLSHTFTANVTWEANNLQKQFTAAAQWAEQGVTHAVTAVANWAEQGVQHAVTAVANWAEQGVQHAVTAVANWAEQNVIHPVTAAAEWADQNLIHPVIAAAQWAEQGVQHAVTAVANWAEQGVEHTVTAVAKWAESDTVKDFIAKAAWQGENLEHTFIASAQWIMGGMPGFAEGTSSAPGGVAMIAEAGSPEVVEHNGQFSLFDQPAFVNLPAGAAVYPMQDLSSSSPRQLASGTVGDVTPISLGMIGGGGSGAPIHIHNHFSIDGRELVNVIGPDIANAIRTGMGMRSY